MAGNERRPSSQPTRRHEGITTPDRYGGPLRRRDDPPSDRDRVSDDEGGFGMPGGARYYGVGEKTHRRSDQTIHQGIRERLMHHAEADAGDIEVQVEGGEVTLHGTVENRDMRWLIEDLTGTVPGVSLVHNRIRIAKR